MIRPAIRIVALAATLLACDPGRAQVSSADCDVLLAHLVVLEGEVSDPVMCKYHPKCEGSERDQYRAQCPQVVTRRDLGCYQRATSLRAADECLPLATLDHRLATGEVEDAEADDATYGFSLRPGDKRAVMLGALARIRDAACACADPTCLITVNDRVDHWMSEFGALQGDPSSTDTAMKMFREIEACRTGKKGAMDDALLPNCAMYLSLIEKMTTCSALPQTSRDSMRDNLPSLRDAYDGTNMSQDVRDQMDASCASGLSSLRDQLSTMGCL